MEDAKLLAHRTWRWLRIRILSLLDVPPAIVIAGDKVLTVPQTRIGYTLDPPWKE